jgi:hypothetical protein
MNTNSDTGAALKPRRGCAKGPGTAPSTPAAVSKSDTVIKLLLRAKGATPVELIAATDWKAHSVRAFLSGLRKKGRAITREARKSGEFAYRIIAAPAPTSSDAPAAIADCVTAGDPVAPTDPTVG